MLLCTTIVVIRSGFHLDEICNQVSARARKRKLRPLQSAAQAILGAILVCACGPPYWVPSKGPEDPECRARGCSEGWYERQGVRMCRGRERPVCTEDYVWVLGTVHDVAVYDNEDSHTFHCGDDDVYRSSNSCGWFRGTLRVQEVVFGELDKRRVDVVGELGEWCHAPRFRRGHPYLFALLPSEGRYREMDVFGLTPGPGGPLVDVFAFDWSFHMDRETESRVTGREFMSLDELRDSIIPSICGGEGSGP